MYEWRTGGDKRVNKVLDTFWSFIEKIAHGILSILFRIIGRNLSEDTFASFMQFVKFGIVGVSNTVVSYGIYIVSLLMLKKLRLFVKYDYFIAQIVAFVLSVLWSFYWNNKMVFAVKKGQKRSVWKTLLKTYVSYSFTGLFLNSILLVLWVQVLGVSEFIAPIANLLISVPVNFVINKFWAFRS